MTKNNPLFVDSTKIQGDTICTQIELKRVLLYDGETAHLRVEEPDGQVQVIDLESDENFSCRNRIWLHHQDKITYQFYIQKEGKTILSGEEQLTKASYFLSELWDPNLGFGHQRKLDADDSAVDIPINDDGRSIFVRDPAEVGALIDKWGL